jgi:hypothetical protein
MENDVLRVKVIKADNQGDLLICNKMVLVNKNGKEIALEPRISQYIKTGV